ncbi:MAG: rRNA-processing protein las1 [Caeruleum heppii]|nr:MAG: rRNA-processing protein las1 [Caeruleum heppii]
MPYSSATAWRDSSELLRVRSQLYPSAESPVDERRDAVELINAWKVRGNLPHLVEASALITEAVLLDEKGVASESFVTRTLDASQPGGYTRTMFAVAREIGLPESFVELRHDATHDELPGLNTLRGFSRRALAWMWDVYWGKIEQGNTRRAKRKREDNDGREDIGNSEAVEMLDGDGGIEKALRAVLKRFVKQRVRQIRQCPHDQEVLLKETTRSCTNICHSNLPSTRTLVDILLEERMMIPSHRRTDDPMTTPFVLWDPVLADLSGGISPFRNLLIEGLLHRLASRPSSPSPSNTPQSAATQDSFSAWLAHLLTSPLLSPSSAPPSHPTLPSILTTLLRHPSPSTLRLARTLTEHFPTLRASHGVLVDLAAEEWGVYHDVLGGGGQGAVERGSDERIESETDGEEEEERGFIAFDLPSSEEEEIEEEDEEDHLASSDHNLPDEDTTRLTTPLDAIDNDKGIEDSTPQARSRTWYRWRGPWAPRPIGVL